MEVSCLGRSSQCSFRILGKISMACPVLIWAWACSGSCTHSIGHCDSELIIIVVTNHFIAQPKAKDLFILQQLRCLGHNTVPPLLIVRVQLAVVNVPVAEELRNIVKKAQAWTTVLIDVTRRNGIPYDGRPRVNFRGAAPHAKPFLPGKRRKRSRWRRRWCRRRRWRRL